MVHGESNNFFHHFIVWMRNSTMDGLPNIAESRKSVIRLIFWLIMFGTCLGLCIFVVTKNIKDYLEFEVTTTDRVVAKDEIPFPVVTICNQNPFVTPEASTFIKQYIYENFQKNITSSQDLIDLFGSEEVFLKEVYWFLSQLTDPKYNETLKRSFGYSFDDMFPKVTFNELPIDLTNKTQWYFDPLFGNCYRFNLQELNEYREGYGLFFEAFIGLPYELNNYLFEPMAKGKVL